MIVQEFVDVETAKQAGRGGFGEMLRFLKSEPTCRTILVEKTDRLYRNIKDWTTVDDLDVSVHFVKENAVVSKASRSSDKFLHGIKVLMAKNYVENLSEEVKKGLREKAEQGHWPTVAHVGYVNNRETRRIEVDPVRGPLVAKVFELYATGEYSLAALRAKAREIGLTHRLGTRPMTKSELHRMLQNPIYTGDFRWLGKIHRGSHTPLISARAVRAGAGGAAAQATRPLPQAAPSLHGAAHLRAPRLRLRDDGRAEEGQVRLLPLYRASRGAAATATSARKRSRTSWARRSTPSRFPPRSPTHLEQALQASQSEADHDRRATRERLQKQHRALVSKLDRGYDDYVEGRISEDFWTRKSEQWEDERRALEANIARLDRPSAPLALTGQKILELAKQAGFLYRTQDPTEQRRLLDTVLSNCTFDRGSLCPTYNKPFDLFVRGNETGNWRRGRDSNPR